MAGFVEIGITQEEYDKRIRNKAIDEFVAETIPKFTEFDLKYGYPTIADCKIILRDTAEQMKGE